MDQLTTQIIEQLFALAQEAAQRHNLPSAAVLLNPLGEEEIALPSRVASDKNALAHADLQVIGEGCRKVGRISLSGYRVVSVFEPSLMTISACYWACIAEIAYFVPALPFLSRIPWASEGISIDQKTYLAKSFLEPVLVTKLEDPDNRFRILCNEYVERIVKKE